MSDPYAPPGSQRDPARGGDRRRSARQLPPSTPQPPGPRRDPRPPDPDGAVRTARLGMRFSLLVLAGLVALYLPLPWSVGGTVFLVVGGVVGVLAVVSAVRARLRAGSVVALSIGLAMTALLVVAQAVNLALWPVSMENQRCRTSALTATALAACDAEYQQQLNGVFGTSLTPGG